MRPRSGQVNRMQQFIKLIQIQIVFCTHFAKLKHTAVMLTYREQSNASQDIKWVETLFYFKFKAAIELEGFLKLK